ncbi:sigma 54-interacting transcriptional regulator [Desulfoluna sp.]|uniref:sigma-54 interaction domain-containing protein n=1 Tax=Desulfoluna sp. TaxID=2045199 RepID=UPI002615902C|nr:sigma 54-interacting transcriptional regulator [Desulfoluna sp.]
MDDNLFFREAATRICGTLDIQAAMQGCYDYIKTYLPVGSVNLLLYDGERHAFRSLAMVSVEDDPVGTLFSVPEKSRDFLARRNARDWDVEVYNRPDEDPDLCGILHHFDMDTDVSLMSLRLQLEGSRIGEVNLKVKGRNRYTDAHVRLVKLLHDPLAMAMANALTHEEILTLKDLLADENRFLHRQLREISGADIVGAGFGLKKVMGMARQVAGLESPVLLLGETGAGKDVIASAIHYSSSRKDGPFIKVNCGAIPESLIDSELFGYEKGAFTGALARKRGRFERANGGTLFLDEIGELPLAAQVRLLHVLQSHEIERVGGSEVIPVDVRIIAATHRNLQSMVEERSFREDLWFRLNVFPIMIPPLRHRREDIPDLVLHFVEKKARELKMREVPILAPGAAEALMDYPFPGNVRELQNLVERALIQYSGGFLQIHVRDRGRVQSVGVSDGELPEELTLDEVTALHIRRVLSHTRGRINGHEGAAQLLGLHPNTLRKRLDKLGIPYGRSAQGVWG